jgi:DUF4097 and DUF4098 domain-containing protein YvlB
MNLPTPKEMPTLRFAVVTLLAASLAPALAAAAPRSVDQKLAADPQGSVEISNVAGRVEVQGWDRAEIAVTGTLGEDVERLEFTSSGGRAEVRVILPKKNTYRGDGDADLVIRVPARSAVTTNVVSADYSSRGVSGRQQVQSVSGNVEADVGPDSRINSVSGDVRVGTRAQAGRLEVRTVSGDVQVTGGAGGEFDVNSVSGDARLALGTVTRGRFKSVSGDLRVEAALASNGRFEAESVSGDVTIAFAGRPPADYDVETLSGSIENCYGPKPVEPKYGPGSRLTFREGAGSAQVRIDTKSGDVNVCAK